MKKTVKEKKQKKEYILDDLTTAFLRGLYMGDILCRYETDEKLDIEYKSVLFDKIKTLSKEQQGFFDIVTLPRELFVLLAIEAHDEYTESKK